MQQYRLKKMFADVWALESWGVVNFDGMPDYDWKQIKTYHGDNEAIDGYELTKYGHESVSKDYFATYEDNRNIIALHETFDDALEYIAKTSAAVDSIEEIGGSWDVFKKCEFCNDWFTENELDDDGWCKDCNWYVKHGRC